MRFILGLVSGIAIGVVASTLAAGKSGRELRLEFDRIRSDIEKRDFDALGSHLEERFKELQAGLEQRYSEFKDSGVSSADDVEHAAAEAVGATADELAAVPISA